MQGLEIAPIIDIPQALGDEDTQRLAETMTDKELRSLVVIMFQWQREQLAFTRTLSQLLDSVMGNPAGAMLAMQGMKSTANNGDSEPTQLDRLRAAGLYAG